MRGRGPCATHTRAAADAQARRWAEADAARPSSHARGYDRRWARTRAGFLTRNPLCVACEVAGRVTAATVVDHIVPHRGDHARFWDRANWQPLCRRCHDAKTRRGA